MKTRLGFVSNSSSSSFILDKRMPGVDKIIEDFARLDRPDSVDRCTAFAVGKSVIQYARAGIAEMKLHNDSWDLGEWILEWATKLGEENIVFARESDERMGGSFPYPLPAEVILAEMEYH